MVFIVGQIVFTKAVLKHSVNLSVSNCNTVDFKRLHFKSMVMVAMQISSRDSIFAVAANQSVFVFLLEGNE